MTTPQPIDTLDRRTCGLVILHHVDHQWATLARPFGDDEWVEPNGYVFPRNPTHWQPYVLPQAR